MKFAIRDDDTNYFTMPQDLINNYGRIWDTCPISLSIVPFHECTRSGAIPRNNWKGTDRYPIGENKELMRFLKEMLNEGKISIMLHGYSHKDTPNGYEFETGTDLYNKIKRGKEYLEELFNAEVKVFVPPHNTLSKQGLAAVINNGMHLVNIPSFRFAIRPFHVGNIIPFIKQKAFRSIYGKKYPYVLSFGSHREIGYYSLTPQVRFEKLKENFDFCYKKNGVFVLATHYWEFASRQSYNPDIPMGDVFREFWEYVRKLDNVSFVSINDIFNN